MRFLKHSVIGLIVSLVLLSCVQSESNMKTGIISIKLDEAVPLMDAAFSVEGLNLKDSLSEHFPGHLSKVEWVGNSILILDTWKDPGLYMYDSDGVLVNSYTNRGNGPADFVKIKDFNVLPSGFVLLDTYSASKRIYLDKNFSFLHKVDGEPQAIHFFCERDSAGGVWYDRGNVAYGPNKDKLIYVVGNSRKTVLPVPHDVANITFASYNVFTRVLNDTILYLPAVEPRIYKCYDGHAEVLCELDFQGSWPDFSGVDKNQPWELMNGIVKDGKVYSTNMLSEGNDVAFSFYCKEDLYILKFKYDDLQSHKLFKLEKKLQGSLALVAIKDGCLVFGEPGKLVKVRID